MLPDQIFAGTRAGYEFAIAKLGRAAVYRTADGTAIPCVIGLARPRQIEVVQAYGENARYATIRQIDMREHVPAKFERIEFLGDVYTLQEIGTCWINDQIVGWRAIAMGPA